MRGLKAEIIIGLVALIGLVGLLVVGSWERPTPAVAGTDGYARWSRLAELPVARIEAAGATVGDRLLVVSGFVNSRFEATSRVDLYDPATDDWTRLADIPEAVTHANLAVDGNEVWVAGGFQGDHPGPVVSDVWRYDLATDEWAPGPPLPSPRGGGALVRSGRQLHYFGGFRPGRRLNAGDHWVLALDSPSAWRDAAPMPDARGQMGVVEIGGEIYALGGQFFHDAGTALDVDLAHVYDPDADTWRRIANLPRATSHVEASTFAHRGRAFVVGGRSNKRGIVTLADILMYDPTIDTWIGLDTLPEGLLGPVGQVIGGELVVAGGTAMDYEHPRATTWRRPLDDVWAPGVAMPVPLGAVAAGRIGKKLYVVGRGSPATLAYDLSRREWSSTTALSSRPFPRDHHAAEVVNGRLYLLGGSGDAAGRTQVYDPTSDTWTIGENMPFVAGSSASASIDGKIYVVGGIVEDETTDRAAVYDPENDEWREISPMPSPRSHAAYGTDGLRLYVFGGRAQRSGDADGVAGDFADVQIYDPATDTWASGGEDGTGPSPLPRARTEMGRAVFAEGRFYIFGGETSDGAGGNPQRVHDRVDIYDPTSDAWQTGAPMPTARHGISPVVVAGHVFVAGGGSPGEAISDILEVYAIP